MGDSSSKYDPYTEYVKNMYLVDVIKEESGEATKEFIEKLYGDSTPTVGEIQDKEIKPVKSPMVILPATLKDIPLDEDGIIQGNPVYGGEIVIPIKSEIKYLNNLETNSGWTHDGHTILIWTQGARIRTDRLSYKTCIKMGLSPELDSILLEIKKVFPPPSKGPDQIMKRIPGINQRVKNPLNNHWQELSTVIITLNDIHHWSREQIADWLDTLDDQPKFSVLEGGEPLDE